MTSTVDVGEDTDTVAAVTGGLARAVYGIEAVAARWTGRLPVPLPGYGDRRLRTADLIALAGRLDAEDLGTPADPPSAIPPISTHK